MVTLDITEPGRPEFEQTLTELIAAVRHHVNDEEQEELPTFRAKVGAEKMGELDKKFLAAKRKTPTAAHPHAPDEGKAERILGALTKPQDQVKAAASGKGSGRQRRLGPPWSRCHSKPMNQTRPAASPCVLRRRVSRHKANVAT